MKKEKQITFDQIIEKTQDYKNFTSELRDLLFTDTTKNNIVNSSFSLEENTKHSSLDTLCKYAEIVQASEAASYHNKVLRFKYFIPKFEVLLRNYLSEEILADLAEKNIDFKTFDANTNSSHYSEDEIKTIYKELDILFRLYRKPNLEKMANEIYMDILELAIKTQRIENLLNNFEKIDDAGLLDMYEFSTSENL